MAASKKAYKHWCARCHGNDFTGGNARESLPQIPDFTKGAWQARRTDGELLVSILDGKGTDMPSFRGRLSMDRARGLVAYIRQAGPATKKATEPAPDDFDRRFRDLLKQLEELKKQYRRQSPPAPQP
jgi:mono/diheme cytochrome c family protein